MASTVAALGALDMSDGSQGPHTLSALAAATDAPAAQANLQEMAEDVRDPSPAVNPSRDQMSLLLQNIHRAIDAASKGHLAIVVSVDRLSKDGTSGSLLEIIRCSGVLSDVC
ncbi:hypothetical protein ABBQ32_003194 [Trebouxia sp. C0010 RCD-2024]